MDLVGARQALLPAQADRLSVIAATETSLTLDWERDPIGTEPAAREIGRYGESEGQAGIIASTSERRYTDTGLVRDTRYEYTLSALDADGRRSAPRFLQATTAGGPAAPASVRAVAYSTTTVEVMWPRASGGATYAVAYEVYRDGELIATVDALSLMQNDLTPGTEYRYTLRSVAADGRRSSDSVETTVRTPTS